MASTWSADNAAAAVAAAVATAADPSEPAEWLDGDVADDARSWNLIAQHIVSVSSRLQSAN